MRRHPFRVTRLGAVLTIAVGLLTPMAANMVGAQAGLPVVIAQETPVVTVSPVRPRGFHPARASVRTPSGSRGRPRSRSGGRTSSTSGARPPRTRVRGRRTAGGRGAGGARSTSGSRSWRGSRRSRTTVAGGGWSPYTWPRREGWIRLAGLSRGPRGPRRGRPLPTPDHRPEARPGAVPGTGGDGIAVFPDAGRVLRHGSGGVLARQLLGSFAFGISGIQPWLPAGWSGGNQLAIHGTNNPSSIGRSASAGMRAGLRDDARSAAATPSLRHAGDRARLIRGSGSFLPIRDRSTKAARSFTWASSCPNGSFPTSSCPTRWPSDFFPRGVAGFSHRASGIVRTVRISCPWTLSQSRWTRARVWRERRRTPSR